jgi:hypothetical protein
MTPFSRNLFVVLAILVVTCLGFVMFYDGGLETNASKIVESLETPAHSKSFERVDSSKHLNAHEPAQPSRASTSIKSTELSTDSLPKMSTMIDGSKSQMPNNNTTIAESVGGGSLSTGTGAQSSGTALSSPGVVDIPMTAGVPIREITIPVPEGAMVPALFHDDVAKPAPQMKALDKIATEFEKNVSEIPPEMTREEVWEAAKRFADESYITLFGFEAYNQLHIQAAKEALKEKRARSNATTP